MGTIETQHALCSALTNISCSEIFVTAEYPSHSVGNNSKVFNTLISKQLLVICWKTSRFLAGRFTVALIAAIALTRLFFLMFAKRPSVIVFYTCIFPTPILVLKHIFSLPMLSGLFPTLRIVNFIQGTPSFSNIYINDPFRRIESSIRLLIYKNFYASSDFIVVSTPSLRHLIRNTIFPPNDSSLSTKVRLIPNGILDLRSLSPNSSVKGLSLPSPEALGEYNFFFVGRLTYQKNIVNLVRSFVLAIEKSVISSNSTLTLIGNGDLSNDLIKNFSHFPQIKFLGFKQDPWQSLTPSSIVIVPSFWEEPGHVPLEALSRGFRTLISTGCSVIDFIPSSFQDIVCFNPRNTDDIFSSIRDRTNLATWNKIFPLMDGVISLFTKDSFEESISKIVFEVEQ
ncbi:glycosyltransferase [bacterium]|nr:glycosyltransferase [bacterium]